MVDVQIFEAEWGRRVKYLDIYVMISPARGDDFEITAKSDAGGEGNSAIKRRLQRKNRSGILCGYAASASAISLRVLATP